MIDNPGRGDGLFSVTGFTSTQAYPAAPYGTVLPFRRVFVVAQAG